MSCEGKNPYLLRLVFSTLSGPTLPLWNVLPDSPPQSWEDKQDRFCSHPSESPHVRSAGRCWLWKQRCRIPKEHKNRVKWILHLFGNSYQRERELSKYGFNSYPLTKTSCSLRIKLPEALRHISGGVQSMWCLGWFGPFHPPLGHARHKRFCNIESDL